jgi:hypothetical protein
MRERAGLAGIVRQPLTRKVPKPLSAGEVASLVEDISAWTIHSPGPGDVLSAIELHERAGISFWDAFRNES